MNSLDSWLFSENEELGAPPRVTGIGESYGVRAGGGGCMRREFLCTFALHAQLCFTRLHACLTLAAFVSEAPCAVAHVSVSSLRP